MQRTKAIDRLYQSKHMYSILPRPTSGDVLTAVSDDQVAPYVLDELAAMKAALNIQKSKLDVYYEMSNKDEAVGRQMIEIHGVFDTYKHLKTHIEKEKGAWPVTNAWMKYWEIYNEYNLVPNDNPPQVHGKTRQERTPRASPVPYTAFFNAELPGAALCALNHYMKTIIHSRTGSRVNYEWWASSLAPGESTGGDGAALGDTYGLYAANRDRWLMNETNNGDATVLDNLLDFERRLGSRVDLYSHDAGINVSDDFNNQELANAKVHLGCAIAGFMTLKVGGSFIAKQYTYFETFTWNLLLIYASMFETFYLCKPLTSRPYNSEIYLVGKGFLGFDPEIRRVLIGRLTNFHTGPFIPADAVSILWGESSRALRAFARAIFGQQGAIIEENVTFIERFRWQIGALRAGLEAHRRAREKHWLDCYPVPRIAARDNLKTQLRK